MIGADTTFLVQLEIRELPNHNAAHDLLHREIIEPRVPVVLAPQVLAEFIHVVTDGRRFRNPLSMNDAIEKANFWWKAAEVKQVFPSEAATQLFLNWMAKHNLGRKRILDTQLAAIFRTEGVETVLTSNASDFSTFGFRVISP